MRFRAAIILSPMLFASFWAFHRVLAPMPVSDWSYDVCGREHCERAADSPPGEVGAVLEEVGRAPDYLLPEEIAAAKITIFHIMAFAVAFCGHPPNSWYPN